MVGEYHWYHRGPALPWRVWKYPSRCQEAICPETLEDIPVLGGESYSTGFRIFCNSSHFQITSLLSKWTFRTEPAIFPKNKQRNKTKVDFLEGRDTWMFLYTVWAALHADGHLADTLDIAFLLYGIALNSIRSQVRMSLPCPALVICRRA